MGLFQAQLPPNFGGPHTYKKTLQLGTTAGRKEARESPTQQTQDLSHRACQPTPAPPSLHPHLSHWRSRFHSSPGPPHSGISWKVLSPGVCHTIVGGHILLGLHMKNYHLSVRTFLIQSLFPHLPVTVPMNRPMEMA